MATHPNGAGGQQTSARSRHTKGPTLFAAFSRFIVRFRWLVIVAWLVGTVALATLLPSLGSVAGNGNAAFLPASSPSVRADALAATFQSATYGTATYIAAVPTGTLTSADDTAIDGVEQALRKLPRVLSVTDQGVSANGRAREALVVLDVPAGSSDTAATRTVKEMRATLAAAGAPAGLAMHLTGSVPQAIDQQQQTAQIQGLTELLSFIFILVLLLVIFRAALAPIVALFPSAVALVAAGPLIAASSHLGIAVSSLTQILLVVIMLGAGTDYGLFLIFRVREEVRRGREIHEAVACSLAKVGESITFSALTVIAALASLTLASFGLYKGLGPGLAIGVAVALAANLTLLPALLAVFGRAVFWPRIPSVGPAKRGVWGHVAGRIVGRPVLTLSIGLVVFIGLAASLVAYEPSGFANPPAPARSDSSRGQVLLQADYPSSELDPTSVLYRLPVSVWDEPQVLATAQEGLQRSGVFATVTGVLDADGSVTAAQLAAAHAELAAYGPLDALPTTPPPGSSIPLDVYNAYHASAQFISPDGRTLQFLTSLAAGTSTGSAATDAVPAVRAAVGAVGDEIHATASGVSGNAPSDADVAALAKGDLMKIIPIVLLVLALLLALVLRSLVAPLYLVVSVGLSYLASLGLAVLVFVIIGGQDGINFVLPFLMFIFIMALGEDYNILVMTRIREEARHAPLRVAVRRAVEATGTTVTSAGLILAGTFGVLTFAGDAQVQEIGVGLAAGILLDTFLVRTLLVPSTVVLFGRWNWWPSKLSHEHHERDLVVPTAEELADARDLAYPVDATRAS